MKRGAVLLVALLLTACTPNVDNGGVADERPNILLIVVDDMGFSDIGSFGGEIETPNLDELARAGIRLTNFQSASTCSPTRSMLLTGVDSHLAGLGNMLEELSPNQQGQPGYEGYLNHSVVTLSTMLQDAGYRTMMAGKWHLGFDEETDPRARGFDRSFTLLAGGASHYADMRPAYAPSPDVKAPYWEDGRPLQSLPNNFEYSSQFYVDQLIEYLSEPRDDAPFFAYLAFTAPHWPLQAPDAAVDKYRGRFDKGYDAILLERLARAKREGVVPGDADVNPVPPKHVPWTSIDDARKKIDTRAMEIYAAMIDEVDRHSGRLFDHLRASGEFNDTVIIFMSDNGAEGHDLDETWSAELFPKIRRTIDTTHDFSYEAMGKPGSYVLYGADWGRAGSPAFNLYKAFPTEGGVRVAAFAHYRAFAQPAIVDELMSVKDITPTILELAGVAVHSGMYDGRAVQKITGISQVSILKNGGNKEDSGARVLVSELFGKRSVRRGDWKLVHMPPPYGIDDWQLFNLDTDLAEADDIAGQHPDIVAELALEWERYAAENNVIIPDWVSGY